MMANKYGNFLTVMLVIVITAIVIGVGFLIYNVIHNKNNIDDAIAMFDDNVSKGPGEKQVEGEGGEAPDDGGIGSTTGKRKQYYEGFVMIGYIEISKTGIKYPILEKGTDKSLETSVAVMYPENPVLNTPGNIVIMGHNYKNGKFFSNNKKLATGDKVKITGPNGVLTYTIYEIFETVPGDTSYITRNTNGATEITLTTCTDDSVKRLIILAKAD